MKCVKCNYFITVWLSLGRTEAKNRSETLYDPNVKIKSLTVAVQHNQTRYHQDGVPVELQTRAVPGETAAPLAVPHAHTHHAGQAEAQAQRVAYVETQDGPHPGEIWRLNQPKEQNNNMEDVQKWRI